MKVEWRQLGEKLVFAGSQCKNEAVLVAPFMKAETLKKIINSLSPSSSLVCLTRWRLEEIDIGVSDLECWDIIAGRENSRLLLRSNLHAKFFRFDDVAYLGSANLTMTALGWSARPNAEALIEFRVGDIGSIKSFEQSLFNAAVEVTHDLAAEFKTILESYSSARPAVQSVRYHDPIVVEDVGLISADSWIPKSRSPEYLYRVYIGDEDAMSKMGLAAAEEDLLELDLPSGLTEHAFVNLVGSRLASTPTVVQLDQFISVRRRFGEMRSWLAAQLAVRDATDEWQRLMRWLLFFLPNWYETVTSGYSEVFGKKTRRGESTGG